jgi:hypothetical protein
MRTSGAGCSTDFAGRHRVRFLDATVHRSVHGVRPDLCAEHTTARFERFRERVASAMPDIGPPIHLGLVPLPELAHLAPTPEELRPEDPPTRYERIDTINTNDA